MFGSIPTFEVDFHDVGEGDRLVTLLDRSPVLIPDGLPREVRVGDFVQAWDEESGNCLALVDAVDGARLILKLDWETWEPVIGIDWFGSLLNAILCDDAPPDATPTSGASVTFSEGVAA